MEEMMLLKCGVSENFESHLDCKDAKGNQSYTFKYTLEALIAEAETPRVWTLKQGMDSLNKTPMLGIIEANKRRELSRMRRLDGITDSIDMSLWRFWYLVMDRDHDMLQNMGLQKLNTTERLN